MNSIIPIRSGKHLKVIAPVVWIAIGYLLLAVISLKDYLDLTSLRIIMGIGALAFIFCYEEKRAGNARSGWVALVCMILCVLLPVKTFLYFSISFALLFLLESIRGGFGFLPVFVILLITPVFNYFVDTFSFPIRFELTRVAGHLFNLAGIDTTVSGNVIVQGGNEFTVEPECMGLNMMLTSLLLSTMLLAYYKWRYQKRVSFFLVVPYFLVIFILNVVANLFRILLLVQFSAPPGSIGHELVGIICLLVYIFLPAVLWTKWIVRKSRYSWSADVALMKNTKSPHRHILLLVSLVFLSIYVQRADTYKKVHLLSSGLVEGYQTSLYQPGILKLESEEALIYIKHIRGFYDAEHNPMICWKGSGYVIDRIREDETGGVSRYVGILTRGDDKLYTAWWYSNGRNSTISQWEWRWDMLLHKTNYAVVNVTCSSYEKLMSEIKSIEDQNTLSPFFNGIIYH